MTPVKFEQANQLLKGDGDRVQDLPAFVGLDTNDTPVIVSCFELTDEELAELLKTRHIYLGVAGLKQPPVWITATNPF